MRIVQVLSLQEINTKLNCQFLRLLGLIFSLLLTHQEFLHVLKSSLRWNIWLLLSTSLPNFSNFLCLCNLNPLYYSNTTIGCKTMHENKMLYLNIYFRQYYHIPKNPILSVHKNLSYISYVNKWLKWLYISYFVTKW